MVLFHTWITLNDDDSWGARQDKLERFAAFPAPLFVLSGPGATSGEAFLLVSNASWTAETVRQTLAAVYAPTDFDDLETGVTFDAWVGRWVERLLEAAIAPDAHPR